MYSISPESLMKNHFLAAAFSLALSPLLAVHAADDPPAARATEKATSPCNGLGVATLDPEVDTLVMATGECSPTAVPLTRQLVNDTVP